MIDALEITIAPTASQRPARKSCRRCERPMRGAGTICSTCEERHFPGVNAMRCLMQRVRVPCACGQVAGYVVDFRPVCSGCRRDLRLADCNHRKDWKERRGICRECDRECAPGRKHCEPCLTKARARARSMGYRPKNIFHSEHYAATAAGRMKALRDTCRANGICMNCYKVPSRPGRTRCESCLEKQRIRYHQMKAAGRKPSRVGPTMADLYGGRSDLLTPRGESGAGVDFETLSGITHVYVSKP